METSAVATPIPSPPVSQGSSLSFTQGFLLGQASIALLIFFFIKFFIFGEPPSADDRALHLSSLRRARTLAHQTSLRQLDQRTRSNSINNNNPLNPTTLNHKGSRSVIRNPASTEGPSIATILAKTYYNVKGHQPESLDWFNVLIAQTIAQLRADARQDGAVLTSLNELLNAGSKPAFLGEIKVTEIALGDEFPIFSNCRVMPAEEGFLGGGINASTTPGQEEGRLQARMDVDLSDVITLGIETTLNLNYPKPLVAVLPVALAVSVVRFSGTLALSFIPSSTPPSTTNPTPTSTTPPSSPPTDEDEPHGPQRRPTTLAFTFLDDYRLDLSVRSLVGSRSRLQDVPKIAQLIESRVHAWFDERAVEPRFQQIVLPSLWPRKKNTRGGDEEAIDDDEFAIDEDEELPGEAVDLTAESRVSKGLSDGLGESATRGRPSASYVVAPTSLEARIEADGAMMREAEIRAGVRRRRKSGEVGDGVRYRGEQRGGERKKESRTTNRLRGMPGGMPGV